MNKILIASGNQHKITEIKFVLKNILALHIFSLMDFGISVNVNETGKTLEENAFIKAKEIYHLLKIPTLSDDTGLFVDSLNGDPGIYSARYAGESASYKDNCLKLLNKLKNVPENKRSARFESVLCYFVNPEEFYFFKGVCTGEIIKEERGKNGFGYDPVFRPAVLNKTFAELSEEEKNKISHRAISLKEFKKFSEDYFS